MYFSFKEIQDVFYQKIKALDSTNLSPFYIYEDYLKNIEQELNELIKKSDFCSVLICVDIDNGIYDIRALYDYKDEIYFSVWEYNGFQKQTKIQESDVKKILKAEPKKEIIIDDSGLPISDSTSEYIIKKIKNKTYYYANCEESIDVDYIPLVDLFRKLGENIN